MDATFDPSLCDSTLTESTEYGGILVDPHSVTEGEQLSQSEFAESDLRRKRGAFHEGEVVYVEGETVENETLRGVYVAVDVNPKTERERNWYYPRQFRVLEEITQEHRIVVHRSGKPYKIPVDTKYPCTHRDVPDSELIEIQIDWDNVRNNDGAFEENVHYCEYLIDTKLLATEVGVEDEYVTYAI